MDGIRKNSCCYKITYRSINLLNSALSGMFMQGYQYTVNMGGRLQCYISSEAYKLIFLTATILSTISILLAVILYRTSPPKCRNHLPEEKGDMGTKTKK